MASLSLEVIKELIDDYGLINDTTPSIDIFNLNYFGKRIDQLKEAFPESYFCHSLALKANSIRGVLKFAFEKGIGGECASISEAMHALDLGVEPSNVIYDSPCKTKPDLMLALRNGIVINLDNDHEAEMVNDLIKNEGIEPTSSIGLRINPVVGGGEIDIVSTATAASKFGLPLIPETKSKILDLYKKYDWLNGIHIHVGSQGVPMEKFTLGARIMMDFVKEIESECDRNLKTIDIGGGLSTSYSNENEPEEFAYSVYRKKLEEIVPELFEGKYRIITEFGRSLLLKSGQTLTRIEYVKNWIADSNPILITNVGVNQFIRETYLPGTWYHRYSLLTNNGEPKKGPMINQDISGPLCFQGDYMAKNVSLPRAEIGDIILIHDTGAYTMAMYSKFNSILPSPVYGFTTEEVEGDSQKVQSVLCFKERETIKTNLLFWGVEGEPNKCEKIKN